HCSALSSRPSVEVTAQESPKVEYGELSSVSVDDLVKDSSNEISLIIEYSERVLWQFIHVLSSRVGEGSVDGGGSSADEVN
ncbi:hypothetical protein PMAYCL1PPCAC_07950, partial [Pristionchus mayeri]